MHYNERLVSRGSIALTSAGVLYSAGPCGLYSHVGYDPRGSMFSDRHVSAAFPCHICLFHMLTAQQLKLKHHVKH